MLQPATVTIDGLNDLSVWVTDVARKLTADEARATVIALGGPLGVGKTTFVQTLLQNYGIDEPITSPTYTIETIYQLPEGEFSRAYHLDAYRLEGVDDLQQLHFSERLMEPESIILVEWADRVKDLLPEQTIFIDIQFGDDANQRVINISSHE